MKIENKRFFLGFAAGCGIAGLLVAFVGAWLGLTLNESHVAQFERHSKARAEVRIGMTKAELEKILGKNQLFWTIHIRENSYEICHQTQTCGKARSRWSYTLDTASQKVVSIDDSNVLLDGDIFELNPQALK